MSLENKKPAEDIENIEHHDSAEAKKVVLHGLTTGSTAVPIRVLNDGSIEI